MDETVDADGEEEYLVDHSIVLYLMSPEGQFLDFFTQRTQIGDIVNKVEAHMIKYKQDNKGILR